MSSTVQRIIVVAVAAFAIFGLHGVAVAAPDGACAEVARHHGHVIDIDDAEVTAAGLGASTAGEGVAIPLAILVSGFLLAVIRRTWVTVPSEVGQRTHRHVGDRQGRSPPLRSQLSVWRI